ncbi:MAG TPA: hypothetical protein VMW38_00970, partial [Terriglobia bacterium]|nr:hypothetical protein [Terriglobia bacterium]
VPEYNKIETATCESAIFQRLREYLKDRNPPRTGCRQAGSLNAVALMTYPCELVQKKSSATPDFKDLLLSFQ